jgi:serine/threonine protein kinase
METENYSNSDENFPIIEGIKIYKLLYKTKESTIWVGKLLSTNQFITIKGKLKSKISPGDFEFMKRERAFLESNKINTSNYNSSFPHFIKAWKDDDYLYMILNFIEGATLSSLRSNSQDNDSYCFTIFNFNIFENFLENEQIFKQKKILFLHIIKKIIQCLKDLHRHEYIYRDLKLNNLLINKKLEIFMIDFGYVKKLENSDRTSTICGTYHAFAPEMFKTKFGLENGYDKRSDIWSLGVLIYELFTNNPPFPYLFHYDEEILKNYSEKVCQGLTDDHFNSQGELNSNSNSINSNSNFVKKPNFCDEETDIFITNLIDLIKGCMKVNPEDRYSLEEISKHKIFSALENCIIDYDSRYIRNIIEEIDFRGEFHENYGESSNDVFDQFF